MCVSGGRLTVTSSHSPGSQFPVGETVVQYTATDAAGNTRTCNLTITVQGSERTFLISCSWMNFFSLQFKTSQYEKIFAVLA